MNNPEIELTGRAKGGKARAAKMTSEERRLAALKAVEARKEKALLPSTISEGKLIIGDTELDVAVLEDGKRIISPSSVFKAFGRPSRGTRGSNAGLINTPAFMDAKNLKPFINHDVISLINKVKYKNISGQVLEGYEAAILPLVCDIYLKAREAGVIKIANQIETAKKAEILVRSLAKVGIIALVDEATGYQRIREKNALAKILEEFVAKELRPWVSTFPTDYYEGIFRLHGLKYPPVGGNKSWRPGFIGTITNNIVYNRLAPELLPELKKAASKAERKAKLHQWLTNDIGHPKLREHLASIVTLLKISKTKEQFYELVDTVHPKFGSGPEHNH